MRLRLLAAAAAVLASSLAAHADTLFTYTPSGGSSVSFHLAEQWIYSSTNTTFYTDNPKIVAAVFLSDGYANAIQQAGYGHLDLQLIIAGGPVYSLDGPQLYTGPESAPAFPLGTYNLASDPGLGKGQADGTFVISDDSVAVAPVATAATPEPSSLALLGTGILGLAGAVRRRFVA